MAENYRDEIVRTVKDMLVSEGREDISKFVTADNIYYDEYDRDNYGYSSTNILINIPTDSYMSLWKNDEIHKMEELLKEMFSEAYKGRDNISYVSLRPNSSVHFTLFDSGDYAGWKNGYFKMFISHVSKHKKQASDLKNHLEEYGITSFVAHEDIKPSREWIKEIEKALNSMDGMIAIMYDEFHDSYWCDQEVGIALGRNVPVIPILIEKNPYGFVSEYQGIKAKGKMPSDVAKNIYNTLCDNPNTRTKYISILTSLFLQSDKVEEAIKWLTLIKDSKIATEETWKTISQNIQNSSFLMNQDDILESLNSRLKELNLPTVHRVQPSSIDDDDIPF